MVEGRRRYKFGVLRLRGRKVKFPTSQLSGFLNKEGRKQYFRPQLPRLLLWDGRAAVALCESLRNIR